MQMQEIKIENERKIKNLPFYASILIIISARHAARDFEFHSIYVIYQHNSRIRIKLSLIIIIYEYMKYI